MGAWSTIELDRWTVECFTPAADPPLPFALIYLPERQAPPASHDARLAEQLEQHQLRAMVPAVRDCWWLDRAGHPTDASHSPLEFVRRRLVSEIVDRWNVAAPRIGLLGVEAGGQGALQLAYRFPREFPVVAAIAPAVDFHARFADEPFLQELFPNPEAARQETVTLRLHPLNWPQHQWFACDPQDPQWHEGCERLASKLSSIGIPFEADLATTAGGRRDDYVRLMLPRGVQFVVERLTSLLGTLA